MHLSKEEILKLSLTSQDLLEICTHVKYKSLVFFGLKLQSKIFLRKQEAQRATVAHLSTMNAREMLEWNQK